MPPAKPSRSAADAASPPPPSPSAEQLIEVDPAMDVDPETVETICLEISKLPVITPDPPVSKAIREPVHDTDWCQPTALQLDPSDFRLNPVVLNFIQKAFQMKIGLDGLASFHNSVSINYCSIDSSDFTNNLFRKNWGSILKLNDMSSFGNVLLNLYSMRSEKFANDLVQKLLSSSAKGIVVCESHTFIEGLFKKFNSGKSIFQIQDIPHVIFKGWGRQGCVSLKEYAPISIFMVDFSGERHNSPVSVPLNQSLLKTETIFTEAYADYGFFNGFDVSIDSDLDVFFPTHALNTIILTGKNLPSLQILRSKIISTYPQMTKFVSIDYQNNRNVIIRTLIGSPVRAAELFKLSKSFEGVSWSPLTTEILQSSYSVVVSIPHRYSDDDINNLLSPLPASWNRFNNSNKVQLNYSSLQMQVIVCTRGLSFNHRHIPASRVIPFVRVRNSDFQGAILQKKELFRCLLQKISDVDVSKALNDEDVFSHHFDNIRHYKNIIAQRRKRIRKVPEADSKPALISDRVKKSHNLPSQPPNKKPKMDYLSAATGPKKAPPAVALPSLPPHPSLEEKQIETMMDRLESKLMTFINQRFEAILSNLTPLSSNPTVSQVVDERLNTHLDQKLAQFFDQQLSFHLEQRLTDCFEVVLKRSLEHIDGRFSALLQQNK
jgi:hypothetical protein